MQIQDKIVALMVVIISLLIMAACSNANQPLNMESTNTFDQLPEKSTQFPLRESLICIILDCLEDITLGSTTLAEAQTSLEMRYGNENVTAGASYVSWEIESTGLYSGGYLWADGQGLANRIVFLFPESGLTVTALIERIGEPSHVYVVRAFSSESKCAGAFISYANINVVANLYPENDLVGVSTTQAIQSLEFRALPLGPVTDVWILEWQGFTDYCDLTDP